MNPRPAGTLGNTSIDSSLDSGAGWKGHYSIHGATDPLVAYFKDELAPYEVNDKGTIRFPLSEPIPVKLIERIVKFRAKEVARREKARAAASRKVRDHW